MKLKSDTQFLGRAAMEKQANSMLKKRLAGFVCDDPEVVLLGRETILRNGEQVGYLTSGGFGYTVGKPMGYGYIRKADGLDEDYIRAGNYELVVAQTRVPCTLSLAPLYDPLNAPRESLTWPLAPTVTCSILIIGGGAIGTSLAYHLGRDGAKDVLLVEKAQLTHGCTWHAAGLVGQLRGKRNLTRLMQNSVAVFDRLEAETGQAIEWRKVGSLRLASSKSRWSEIRSSMTQAKSFGVECHSLSAAEAEAHFPYLAVRASRERPSFRVTAISIPML